MKYLSLFSGIGGFETAIHEVFPDAICVGYSEIKPHALEIYKSHFPEHKNLGDICNIKLEKLEIVDLIVGGFPCTNLSSLSHICGDSRGLEGDSSKLFYNMLEILKYCKAKNKDMKFIIENNASMSKKNRELITSILHDNFENVHLTKIDSASMGVQTRKRLYWTNFKVSQKFTTIQTWKDVLVERDNIEPISQNYIDCLNRTIPCKTTCKYLIQYNGEKFKIMNNNKPCRTRWQCSFHSDTTDKPLDIYTYPVGKSRPITASFGNHNVLVDRRFNPFIIRRFEISELEKLFGYPEGYTKVLKSRNKVIDCLGNTVVVYVIKHILEMLL